MMQPRLRFKEFHESWAVQNISEIADVKGGKRIPKGVSLQNEDNGLPYITVSDMSNQTVSQSNIRFVPLEVAPQIKNYKISVHDIYISVAGTLGLVGVIPKDLDGANLTENANKLTNLKCNQKFLLHYLNTDKFKNLIDSTKTVGAQPKLAIYAINSFEVCLPSKNEQTKIASFLSAVDEKITQLTKKHELLTRYKKGVMQKIFSQELRFKADDGNEYPDWECIALEDVLDYIQPTPYLVSSTAYSNEYRTPVLTAGKTFILGYTNETEGIFDKPLPVLIFDDFTTALKFVNFPFKAKSSAMKILVAKSKSSNIRFVFAAIQLLGFVTGDEHKRYWISEYSKLEIPYPSLEEQAKIANFLSAIDDKIQHTKAQLDAAKQYKQGLLQHMLV
jgi:type I restriction enzyme S subunit